MALEVMKVQVLHEFRQAAPVSMLLARGQGPRCLLLFAVRKSFVAALRCESLISLSVSALVGYVLSY